VEAIYVFPLDEHAAVCEFEADVQGKRIVGVVKPKDRALKEYHQAISRGDGAYLLEQRLFSFLFLFDSFLFLFASFSFLFI